MIRYFIPSDGDDPDHPNVFQLHSSSVTNGTVRFADVKARFPLPGSYHFRFKKKFRDGFVWVDMSDGSTIVPSYEGVYTAKVARLPLNNSTVGGLGHSVGGGHSMAGVSSMGQGSVGGRIGGGSGSGAGIGSDDLLNMGSSSVASEGGSAPAAAAPVQGGSQPDDLLGMMGVFDTQSPAAARVAPPMHQMPPPRGPAPPPTGIMGGGVGAGGVGGMGFGTSAGMQIPGVQGTGGTPMNHMQRMQWQQQQQQQQQQQPVQQQQFARFPPQGRGI